MNNRAGRARIAVLNGINVECKINVCPLQRLTEIRSGEDQLTQMKRRISSQINNERKNKFAATLQKLIR